MGVNAGVTGGRKFRAVRKRPAQARGRKRLHMQIAGGVRGSSGLLAELRCGEVVMKARLAIWAILAGAIALTGTAFFASAGVTHWVMSQHRTEVVVRPGPTVYVTLPAKHGHARHRAPPVQAPAAPAGGGSFPSREAARARPDHRGAHARPDHRGAHARPDHSGKRLHGLWPSAAHYCDRWNGDRHHWHHQLAYSVRAQVQPPRGFGCPAPHPSWLSPFSARPRST